MAIVLLGRTRCPLCEKPLERGQDILGFAHFLPRQHRLWRFSDAAFHAGCFETWSDRAEYESLYERAFPGRGRGFEPEP